MKKQASNILGLILLIGIFLYSLVKRDNDVEELKKNGKLYEAKITGTTFSKGLLLTYSYAYGQMLYSATKRENQVDSDEANSFFRNKIFPVIILEKDPTVRELLIFKEDFETYGLTYPDSLRWVYDSLKIEYPPTGANPVANPVAGVPPV